GGTTMGRPEKRLDPTADDLQAFANDLRLLREKAGKPTYRTLAAKIHYSAATISRALGGHALPGLPLVQALVTALGDDIDEWTRRWHELDHELRTASGKDDQPGPARP